MLPRRSSPPGGAPSAGAHYSSGPPSNVQPQSRRDKQSPPRRQPPHSPDELQFAKRTLQKLVQDSHFFPVHDRNNRVQTIRENEIDVGALIGKGGFCEVRTASKRQHHYDAHTGGGGPTYAMKYLSPTKTASSRVFQRGIADLAMEACFLSLMRHDNIIGLHYVSEGSLDENFNCANDAHIGATQQYGQHDEIVMDANGNLQLRRRPSPPQPTMKIDDHLFGYFLLLDPLHETLTDRIERTYIPETLRPQQSSNIKLWDRIRHKNPQDPNCPKVQLAQRLGILHSIASALNYLHDDCRIIYRDVKPDNIGFYRRYHSCCTCGFRSRHSTQAISRSRIDGKSGSHDSKPDMCTCYDEIAKLFDFGLAKELKPKYRKSHPAYPDQDTYKLTGCTGSRRYMAPEVCFSDPYNERADVYSFGMLLYQVSSLVTPFDGFSMGRHEREVLRGGFRPDVKIPSPTSLAASPFASMTKGKKSAGLNTQELYQAMVMDAEGGTEQEDVERRNNVLALKTKRYWPKELPRLIEECWDYDMRYRPDMKEVSYRLQTCIDILFHHHGGGGNKKGRHSKSPDKNESSMFNTASTVDTRTTGASWAHGDAYMGDPQDYVRGYHQQQLQLQLQQQQYQYAQMGHDNIERRRSSGRRGSNNDEMQWR
mmetsp:Transcript_44877/g.94154  ORF Transcript_44877/g.94154 Transcript_44877/m.94154 type:complete len:651 (-) Transcript_44877:581-2533(-)